MGALQSACRSRNPIYAYVLLSLAGDSDICELMTPGRELSPVLKSCGARIGNLSDRLSAVEASFDVVYARKQLV